MQCTITSTAILKKYVIGPYIQYMESSTCSLQNQGEMMMMIYCTKPAGLAPREKFPSQTHILLFWPVIAKAGKPKGGFPLRPFLYTRKC